MGAGSFGGLNSGAAYMAVSRGGFGGSNKNSEPTPKKFNWLWAFINFCFLLIAVVILVYQNADFTKYTRSGVLIEKNQSEHKVKQNYYPDYYFTVKWNDNQEMETFGVGATTYFSCHNKEQVFFVRTKSEYEWLQHTWGILLLFISGFTFLASGLAAIFKN